MSNVMVTRPMVVEIFPSLEPKKPPFPYILSTPISNDLVCLSPPGGGLFFEVRMTKPKPSLSLRCRVTSKHSGRAGGACWAAPATSPPALLGELLTRADATWWGCWPLSSSPPPSDQWQWREAWADSYINGIWTRSSQPTARNTVLNEFLKVISGHSSLGDVHFQFHEH